MKSQPSESAWARRSRNLVKELHRTQGIGGAAAAVLLHEVVDDVAGEAVFQVQHEVRHAEGGRHVPRVVDGIERAAGPVGDAVAVAEELHRGAHDVVALLDQARRGDGAVDAAGHRDQHLLTRGQAPPRASAPSPPPAGTPRPRGRYPPAWTRGPGSSGSSPARARGEPPSR